MIKNFLKTKWQYIVVFAIPWLLMLLHILIHQTWFVGEGSILYKDAGNLYVQLYSELWDNVHNGESIAFSWNAGFGMEFGLGVLRYLISPFTLVVLLIPKSAIADVVQIGLVLKWSLVSVSMLYYMMHTKYNRVEKRRDLIAIVLAMVFFMSNTMVSMLHDLSFLDCMITFPILLLLIENFKEKKNIILFYALLSLTILMNYQVAISILIFLVFWFVGQFVEESGYSKKTIFSFVGSVLAAIASGMIVILPNVMSDMGTVSHKLASVVSLTEFIQRFFVCDSLLLEQANQPMLYSSIVAVMLMLLFFFTGAPIKKKVYIAVLMLLLCGGVILEPMNLLWNGLDGDSGKFGFLFAFMIMYMTMETLRQLDVVKMWQIAIVGLVSIVLCIVGFFCAPILLEFYVYLATFLIVCFVFMMLFFYRKGSIQYQNVLVVLGIVAIMELSANTVYQLRTYDEYRLEDVYYHNAAENLTKSLSLEDGEKVAMVQNMHNYGMKLQLPVAAWSQSVGDPSMQNLYEALGMEYSDEGYSYFGGSPLLNAMFHIRYGLGQNEMSFSDCQLQKSSDEDYNLYKMNRLLGLGYMVSSGVADWDLSLESPFEIQNDFVKKATGVEGIFTPVSPQMNCMSLAGKDPNEEHDHEHEHEHEHGVSAGEEQQHSHDADDMEIYYGEYIGDAYYYHFQKIYDDDYVNMSFKSDGVTDYYIHVKGADKSLTYVQINGEFVYMDQLSGYQKTFHIGVIPEGTTISLISNFEIDGMDYSEIWYRVAGFDQTAYDKVYEVLATNTLQVSSYDETCIKGNIVAEEDGVMMTSIPMLDGMSVMVDGQVSDLTGVGGALLSVPLQAGEHEIAIEYKIPYLLTGFVISVIGVLVFALCCVFSNTSRKEMKKNETEG